MLSYPWWLNNTPRIPILRKWDFLSAAAEGAREGEFPRNSGRARGWDGGRASPLGNPGGGHGGLLPPAREDPGDQLYNNLQMRPFTLFQLLQLRVQGHFQQRFFQMRWCHLTSISCSKCSIWSLRLASLISNNSNLEILSIFNEKVWLGAWCWTLRQMNTFFSPFLCIIQSWEFPVKRNKLLYFTFAVGKTVTKDEEFWEVLWRINNTMESLGTALWTTISPFFVAQSQQR